MGEIAEARSLPDYLSVQQFNFVFAWVQPRDLKSDFACFVLVGKAELARCKNTFAVYHCSLSQSTD